MSVVTGSPSFNNSNFPRVPAASECVTNRSITPFTSDDEETSGAEVSSNNHTEDETVDEEENEENDSSFDGENNERINVSMSSSRRESESSGDYGLLAFNQTANAAAAAEAYREHQLQEEHLDHEQLRGVAKAYVKTLSDVRVEELIAQIRNRLYARQQPSAINQQARIDSDDDGDDDGHEEEEEEEEDDDDDDVVNEDEEDPRRRRRRKKRRRILKAMIRSLGADWNHLIDRSVMDSLRRIHQTQSSGRRSDSIINQFDNSHGNAVLHLPGDGNERRRQRINSRRRQYNICIQLCPFQRKSCDEVNHPLQMRHNPTTGAANDPENVNPDAHSVAGTEKLVSRFRKRVTSINMNIVVAILAIFLIAIVGFIGVFVFFIANPTNVTLTTTNETERAVVKLTKTITKTITKSMPITAPNAACVRTDYFKEYIVFSTQMANNRSNYETTFLDEFVHIEAAVSRYMKTNETCAQISVEIICCETFCEGKLKEGHIITRYFPRYSQFCGAWRYEFNTAYICTRKRDQITITEFWSAKDSRFSHPTVNIANFQAIDYLPSHVAVILTKNSSKSHQFCLAHFSRRTVKQMKCRDIDFLGLEPMDKSMTRHVVYLQHNIWAVVTSKLENNYLQWKVYVFKDLQLIMEESDNLFSVDRELVVFGESPIVKVCAIELKINQEEKLVSCTAYKYEMP